MRVAGGGTGKGGESDGSLVVWLLGHRLRQWTLGQRMLGQGHGTEDAWMGHWDRGHGTEDTRTADAGTEDARDRGHWDGDTGDGEHWGQDTGTEDTGTEDAGTGTLGMGDSGDRDTGLVPPSLTLVPSWAPSSPQGSVHSLRWPCPRVWPPFLDPGLMGDPRQGWPWLRPVLSADGLRREGPGPSPQSPCTPLGRAPVCSRPGGLGTGGPELLTVREIDIYLQTLLPQRDWRCPRSSQGWGCRATPCAGTLTALRVLHPTQEVG